MRKAMIVPFALGMVILSGIFLFAGSAADEVLLKNRYFQLKEFTEKAALAAANYYNVSEETDLAEHQSITLMQNNPLYESVGNQIAFVWDLTEEKVTVGIVHAQFYPFWLRMFGLEAVDIDDVNATARLFTSSEVVSPVSKGLMPIAINERALETGTHLSLEYQRLECEDVKCCDFDAGFGGSGSFGGFSGAFDFDISCGGFSMGGNFDSSYGAMGGGVDFGSEGCSQGFPWFPSMSFSADMSWHPDDTHTFYGVDLEADGELQNGVSHNAHWKQIIAGACHTPEGSYRADINLMKMMSDVRFLCADVGDSQETAQLQQAVNAFKKAAGKCFDVALVDDQANISGFITVRLDEVDAKNGKNGYLKIEVDVVENQNNKQVKLVD